MINREEIEKALKQLDIAEPEPFAVRILRGDESIDSFTMAELIAQHENEWVEFKSTMRWNLEAGKSDSKMAMEVAKTLCGFMNTEGGFLIIGVNNKGEALGLDHDFSTLPRNNRNEDGFESAFSDLVKNFLELGYRQNIRDIDFRDYQGKRICVVQVEKSCEPIFCLGEKEHEFYVRVGNSTRRLDVKEAITYVKERFWECQRAAS